MPTLAEDISVSAKPSASQTPLEVSLLTGGVDRPYAQGLAMALIAKGVRLDVIGSDYVDSPEMQTTSGLRFFNLWPPQSANRTAAGKLSRVLRHYASLIRYTAAAKPKVFHILWNSKVQFFDRTLLMLYYKAMRKRVTLTAHNVNEARRDGKDSFLNRLTLRMQYRLTDHIFVHTQKMKDELISDFGVRDRVVTVIRHPINDAFPDTSLTSAEAKQKLGLQSHEKALLCFGRIKPYKGIEHMLETFQILAKQDRSYRLIIAGEAEKRNEDYLNEIRRLIPSELMHDERVLLKAQFIPDEDVELYLKAADVMVLPYNQIFQSGVLFLGYSFGLPVVATDVGSFKEEVVEGRTGFMSRPGDPADLARAISDYFSSGLYKNLSKTRTEIKEHADRHHSWAAVAELTSNAYVDLKSN
ncbi:glycosyltransferase family 4 protein [Terracidiphilus sp.]|jgi:glycosyltransferase involved in cell wall biosynthesis|uniref:glycosyltransferase family 4 protein n=1 Tax=Terracidiphilus sp. TaxID=1964191 RepID=UPI003C20EDD0